MDWIALTRAECPGAGRHVYLGRENAFFLCRRAMEEGQRYYAEAAAAAGHAHWSAEVERVRECYAGLVGVPAEDIAFCGDTASLAARFGTRIPGAVRFADASATFGLERLDVTRAGAVTIVTAHGVSIVHVPRGLLDMAARTIVEGSAPNYSAILAIGGALDVILEIGMDAAVARTQDVGARLRSGLAKHAIRIAAERGRVTVVEATRPPECAAQLIEAGIVSSVEPNGIGLSAHPFIRDDDIDRVVDALAAVARGEAVPAAPVQGSPFVCVDLNGVLDAYEGWQGAEHWDAPAPGAREFLETLCRRGCRVVLFTTRYYRDTWRWLETHGLAGFISEVTDRKPPADVFVDDRAVSFRGNYDEVLRQVDQFRPHWAPRKGAPYDL